MQVLLGEEENIIIDGSMSQSSQKTQNQWGYVI